MNFGHVGQNASGLFDARKRKIGPIGSKTRQKQSLEYNKLLVWVRQTGSHKRI